ncbi:hypothetical protein BCD49_30040 [Pseudofrankia sp. EUN1h]|nr:hypothetical protein BCD49_30040 [Pseudofrankia sp. EUN1h]
MLAGILADSASAVPGLVHVTAVDTLADANREHRDIHATANCPPGKQVLGAGAEAKGAPGQVLLEEIKPLPSGLGATTSATPRDGSKTAQWSVTAYAICADPLPNLHLVENVNDSHFEDKSVTATCPPGQRVVGGGASIDISWSVVIIDQITPDPGLTSVTAHASSGPLGYNLQWHLSAYALCADAPPGLELRTAAPLEVPAGSANASATNAVGCSPGKQVLGSFGSIVGGDRRVLLTKVAPLANQRVSEFGASNLRGSAGVGPAWSVIAQAVCADI